MARHTAKLYEHTYIQYRAIEVQVNVFRLRDGGGRLLPATIKKNGPVAGTLRVHERARYEKHKRILLATLTNEAHEYLLFPLDQAWVKRVTDSGLLITGLEIIPLSPRGSGVKGGKYAYLRQTWWAVFAGTAGMPRGPDSPTVASEPRRLAVDSY